MNNFYVGVPFSGCEKHIGDKYLVATREDEAIGIAVGAWFAGKEPLVFMQNSGLGNCVDIITSLLNPYGIKIALLIDNRHSPEHHRFMFEAISGKEFRCDGESIDVNLMEILDYDSYRCC
jgi:hypothetical protein